MNFKFENKKKILIKNEEDYEKFLKEKKIEVENYESQSKLMNEIIMEVKNNLSIKNNQTNLLEISKSKEQEQIFYSKKESEKDPTQIFQNTKIGSHNTRKKKK